MNMKSAMAFVLAQSLFVNPRDNLIFGDEPSLPYETHEKIDIQKEYDLILKKKSKLSANKRKAIVSAMDIHKQKMKLRALQNLKVFKSQYVRTVTSHKIICSN